MPGQAAVPGLPGAPASPGVARLIFFNPCTQVLVQDKPKHPNLGYEAAGSTGTPDKGREGFGRKVSSGFVKHESGWGFGLKGVKFTHHEQEVELLHVPDAKTLL